MALIRCPNCDTLHDLEGSFFAAGARKVRCATCREVWEASDPETSFGLNLVIPKVDPARAQAAAGPIASAPSLVDAANTDGADISAEELEAMFADAEPAAPSALSAPLIPSTEPRQPEPASLTTATASPAETPEKPAERRSWRKAKPPADPAKPASQRKAAQPATVALLAAGLGTLATLAILRQEAVRIVPQTAAIFEAVGLPVGAQPLDIDEVRSRLVREDGRETLEITGVITNLTKAPQKIPIMRLSIRSGAGQEIYVWTATADLPELRPGEKTAFRRRLASPPEESHSVMVRFVAKDDIVAAIR